MEIRSQLIFKNPLAKKLRVFVKHPTGNKFFSFGFSVCRNLPLAEIDTKIYPISLVIIHRFGSRNHGVSAFH